MKPQLIWRQTITDIVGRDCISAVHGSSLQWVQRDISWSVWHISDVYTVPTLLWQSLVHCRLVQHAQTANTHSLVVLNADVSTIIRHDTLVCTQHRCTRTFYTTWHTCLHSAPVHADILYNMTHLSALSTGAECRQVCHVVQNVRVHRCWVQTSVSCCVECPRAPVLSADKCVVSNDRAHISIQYNETVRVRSLRVLYKAAMDKALSEKCWDSVDITDVSHGSADVTLNSLQRGTMYRAYAVASNDVGDSLPSDELWFHTVDCEHVDVRVVSKWIMFSCSFTGWNGTCRSRDFCTLYLCLSGTYLFQLLVLVLGSEWSTYHYFKFFRHFNFLNFVFKTLA